MREIIIPYYGLLVMYEETLSRVPGIVMPNPNQKDIVIKSIIETNLVNYTNHGTVLNNLASIIQQVHMDFRSGIKSLDLTTPQGIANYNIIYQPIFDHLNLMFMNIKFGPNNFWSYVINNGMAVITITGLEG